MAIEALLWIALVNPPAFRPADLSMQFESAARMRSMHRAIAEQQEGARRAVQSR